MESKKIFVFLVFAVTSPLVYSKRESFWGSGVFPDDREWLPARNRPKHLDHSKTVTETKNYEICETQECQKVAKEFLSSMNKSIDPCEDFYEFTCGGWSPEDVIPPSFPAWSRFLIFDNTVKHRIKGVLESPPEPTDILPVRQAKKWFKSCMDAESLERRGVTPIESVLMQIGGWPITMDEEEWSSDEYTWQRVDSHYARLTGSNAFWRIIAFPPYDSSETGGLMILEPDAPLKEQLPLSYRNYSGNDYVAYVKFVESAAKLFVDHNGAHVSEKTLRKRAEEIVEFEKALFEIKSSGGEGDEVVFEDLADWYDNITNAETHPTAKIDLPSAIQELFGTVNIKIDPETAMLITSTAYFKRLVELLKKTPARTIVDYVHWTFVSNMLIYTTETLRNELLAFVWQEYGVKERPARWHECVTDMKMTHAAAYVFVEKYFKKTTENAALEMIENIRTEMGKKIVNSNWLDEESKMIAKDKLDSMKIFLGFPDWYKNKTAVINYYKGMTVGADYFDNILSYTRYEKKAELKTYLAKTHETWIIDPITVNAVYDPGENVINLPAVDFQTPLFTPQLPDPVNYGIAGVVIGHEIGHGFDDSGITFGKNGNKTELSEKILKSYYQRADCFTDQFEEYYRQEESSDAEGITDKNRSAQKLAEMTRGENMADTTGIQAVYQAYRKLDKNRVASRLPGLEEFNEDQLFFLSFAAMWCEIETPQYREKHRESYDPHSPEKLRVIGAVSNTKDFAEVFNCPKGSAMNPTDKCNIWEKSEATPESKPFSIKRKHRRWETQWKT